jgi:[calcium/calmodulin-dependent protein kinase] kinase
MCPEMFQGTTFRGIPADIWACGVVLYQMVSKKALPFSSNQLQDLQKIILNEEPNYSKIPDPLLVNLLKHIFIKDPARRFTIDDIKNHPWITINGQDPMRRLDSN